MIRSKGCKKKYQPQKKKKEKKKLSLLLEIACRGCFQSIQQRKMLKNFNIETALELRNSGN